VIGAHDHDLDAEGDLRGSPVVRTGINFGVPWRRAGRLLTRAH